MYLKLTLILLLLSANGCSLKPRLVYIQSEPFAFQQTVEPKERIIRVYKGNEETGDVGDVELFEAYIDKFRKQIRFHNQQIEEYNNFHQLSGDNNDH